MDRLQTPTTFTMVTAVDLGAPNASTVHEISIASEMVHLGYETTLVAPRPSNGRVALMPAENVRLRFSPSARRAGLPNFVNFLLVLPKVMATVLRGRANVLYVRMGALSLFVTLLGRLLGRSRIIGAHNGWLPDELEILGKPRPLCRVAGVLQVLDAKASHVVRVVDARIGDTLVAHGVNQDTVFVAGNGTDTTRIHPMARAEATAACGLPPARRYLGFIGTLTAWQGVDQAIEALAEIAQHEPQADLLVVGDGPERANLERLARRLGLADWVHFVGYVPLDEVTRWLNCFDVAVAPKTAAIARMGMSPLKLRDYAAAGCAVVAPDVDGIRQFADAGWAALHTPDSPHDLAAKVMELLGDDNRRAGMGVAARAYAEEHFGWDRTAAMIAAAVTPSAARGL